VKNGTGLGNGLFQVLSMYTPAITERDTGHRRKCGCPAEFHPGCQTRWD